MGDEWEMNGDHLPSIGSGHFPVIHLRSSPSMKPVDLSLSISKLNFSMYGNFFWNARPNPDLRKRWPRVLVTHGGFLVAYLSLGPWDIKAYLPGCPEKQACDNKLIMDKNKDVNLFSLKKVEI